LGFWDGGVGWRVKIKGCGFRMEEISWKKWGVGFKMEKWDFFIKKKDGKMGQRKVAEKK